MFKFILMVFLFQSFTVQAGKVVNKNKIERKIEKEYTYRKINEMTNGDGEKVWQSQQ